MEEEDDGKVWEIIFRTKEETITIGLPKDELSKLARALYEFGIDNKINITINTTKNEILN